MTSRQRPIVKDFYNRMNYNSVIKEEDKIYLSQFSGEVIGAVRIRQKGTYCVLQGLQVDPVFRGRGIAPKLLRTALDEVKNQDCYCFPKRRHTRFLSKLGFKPVNLQDLPTDLQEKYIKYSEEGLILSIYRRNK